jgi:hypothetical protein
LLKILWRLMLSVLVTGHLVPWRIKISIDSACVVWICWCSWIMLRCSVLKLAIVGLSVVGPLPCGAGAEGFVVVRLPVFPQKSWMVNW